MKGFALAVVALLPACTNDSSDVPTVKATGVLTVTSSAFADGGAIPTRYTCAGDGTSPPVAWEGATGATGYALTVTDPDAPGGTFVHWVLAGLPGRTKSLPQGTVPAEAVQGTNDFGDASYGPPCPPEGGPPHRYVFTVYALRSSPPARPPQGSSIEDVLDAISCCVMAKGTLTGTFARP